MKIPQIFHCELCDYSTSRKGTFTDHLLTRKHKNQSKIPQNSAENFHCETCDFTTSKKSHYDNHLLTLKHKNSAKFRKNVCQNEKTYECSCGRNYKDASGLWRHRKLCIYKEDEKAENIILSTPEPHQLISYLIKENKELKTLLEKQSEEAKDMMLQVIGNNNTINSHNKTFNLQVFLNETCKDAMNFSDFMNTIQPNLQDVENVGKNGYINGISDIVIRYLTALDIKKRPVHCSDSKRETIYIKENNVWGEEDLSQEENKMLQLVWDVRDKNANNVHKWRELYPQCLKPYSDKTDQYNYIVHEALGGDVKLTKKEKEAKIISKIAKSIFIDKSKFKT
jgi:hypothetical protein